jgi:small subunit ribosomal protein S16
LAVKIRLMRVGKKKQPTYRVVVADSRSPRDGRFIEILGQYAPRQEPSAIAIDNDRAVHWLQQGAQPTEQTAKLFEIAGVWAAYQQTTGKGAAAKPRARTPKAKTPKPAPEASTATEGETSE